MEIRMFYKSQKEVADVINKVIDAYWNNDIEENNMIELLKKVIHNNSSKITKDGEFTAIIIQRCGKRRIEVLSKIKEL